MDTTLNLPRDFTARARELAERYFRKDKNNCAETVFRSIMQAAGKPCPLEILKMASPFGRGMGEAGCSCGALVGGQMALGCFFGRDDYAGFAPELCARAAKALHNSFREQNGAVCCRILHKGKPFGTQEQFDSCCVRAVNAAQLVAETICRFAEKAADTKK